MSTTHKAKVRCYMLNMQGMGEMLCSHRNSAVGYFEITASHFIPVPTTTIWQQSLFTKEILYGAALIKTSEDNNALERAL